MLVVIANELPPAVRGRMKLWFIEPRPNIFVSGIKDAIADEVAEYLYKSCPSNSGLIIFKKISKTPGFTILGVGNPNKKITAIDGFPLIVEKEIN